jgi:hypothetical protein
VSGRHSPRMRPPRFPLPKTEADLDFQVLDPREEVARSSNGRYRLEVRTSFVDEGRGFPLPKRCVQLQWLDPAYMGPPRSLLTIPLPGPLRGESLEQILQTRWFRGILRGLKEQGLGRTGVNEGARTREAA